MWTNVKYYTHVLEFLVSSLVNFISSQRSNPLIPSRSWMSVERPNFLWASGWLTQVPGRGGQHLSKVISYHCCLINARGRSIKIPRKYNANYNYLEVHYKCIYCNYYLIIMEGANIKNRTQIWDFVTRICVQLRWNCVFLLVFLCIFSGIYAKIARTQKRN